jgi:hypothetical protein
VSLFAQHALIVASNAVLVALATALVGRWVGAIKVNVNGRLSQLERQVHELAGENGSSHGHLE